MPDNPTTDNPSERPSLDHEDWEIALAPYKGNPGPALTLGFHFMALRGYIYTEPIKRDEAIEAIDRAVEVLYPFTEFYEVPQTLFHRLIEGKLTLEEEEKLKALGLKF